VGRPFADVLAAVLRRFAGESLRRHDIEEVAAEVAASFPGPALPLLTQLGPRLWLADAALGPTLSAHDLTAALTARLLDRAPEPPRALVVVGGGDRAEAALTALGGPSTALLVFFAEEDEPTSRRIAAAQTARRRAYALLGDADVARRSARLLAMDGSLGQGASVGFVAAQTPVELTARTALLFSAATALGAPAREVRFAVTGDWAGAALAARRLGLPIGRTVIAGGMEDSRLDVLTLGLAREPVSADFERLYYEASGRDARETARAAKALAAGDDLSLPPIALSALRLMFEGQAVEPEGMRRALLSLYRETSRLLDPEAAAGATAAQRAGGATPIVVMGLRHPARAADAVQAASGVRPEAPAGLETSRSRAACARVAPDAEPMAEAIRDFFASEAT
jgi:threonine synthase